MYDHRILQLAVGGVCIAILTTTHILLEPKYPVKIERGERWLQFIRPYVLHSRNRRVHNAWCLFMMFWDLHIAAATLFATTFLDLRTGLSLIKNTLLEGCENFVAMIMSGSIGAAFIGTLLTSIIEHLLRYGTRPPILEDTDLSSLVIAVLLLSVSISISGLSVYLEYLSLTMGIFHTASIGSFSTLPTDKLCPEAWKDPVADWVWWLA